MHGQRPYVLTIAGFDPTNGAGLTADIKTFEQSQVYGLAVCTGLTLQTEDKFYSVQWRKLDEIENEITVLLKKYPVKAVKFGIVPSLDWLAHLTATITALDPNIQVVVDPVWKSSTGFTFSTFENQKMLDIVLKNIALITPNLEELALMRGKHDQQKYMEFLTASTSVLLKGGHDESENKGTDFFYAKHDDAGDDQQPREIKPNAFNVFPKHGSGCVLSAAITAHLAMQYDVLDACVNGKRYIEKFLSSNPTLLGYHA